MPQVLDKEKKKKNACSTGYSQAVTHPSTKPARRCLTSVIGREPVYSAWYGRRQVNKERDSFCLREMWPAVYTVDLYNCQSNNDSVLGWRAQKRQRASYIYTVAV